MACFTVNRPVERRLEEVEEPPWRNHVEVWGLAQWKIVQSNALEAAMQRLHEHVYPFPFMKLVSARNELESACGGQGKREEEKRRGHKSGHKKRRVPPVLHGL